MAAVVVASSTNIECLERELRYIKNERIKESGKVLVEKIPSYFFTIPASSTGKYHPLFSQGTGGIIKTY